MLAERLWGGGATGRLGAGAGREGAREAGARAPPLRERGMTISCRWSCMSSDLCR